MIELSSLQIPCGKKNFSKTISIPGSKSETNRAVHLACMARGISVIKSTLVADDTQVLQNAWRELGSEIFQQQTTLEIKGTGGSLLPRSAVLDVGESGTTARFLMGVLGLAASHGRGTVSLCGHPRMAERPFDDLMRALVEVRASEAIFLSDTHELESNFKSNFRHPSTFISDTTFLSDTHESNFRHPSSVLLHTMKLRHTSESIAIKTVNIPGHISSQFISSLLMALPTVDMPFELNVTGDFISKPYVDMTLRMMEKFGVKVEERSPNRYFIPGGTFYAGTTYHVTPDASSASYFLALAAIHGAEITIEGLQKDSQQRDVEFVDVLERMGCEVLWSDKGVTLRGKELCGVVVDMNHFSDVAPTLAVVSLFAKGRTEIRNVRHMRLKECDRISACVTELKRLGACVEELEDGFSVEGGHALRAADIETYQDHRMAMAFSLAGSLIPGVKIKNPSCVSKTFPGFFSVLFEIL